MGNDQPFGTEGICLGGMLQKSQDGSVLWALKIKKYVEDWRLNQQHLFMEFILVFRETHSLCPKYSLLLILMRHWPTLCGQLKSSTLMTCPNFAASLTLFNVS